MMDTRTEQDVVIIEIPSAVDGEKLQSTVKQLLGADKKRMALDLTQLSFVESSGLGMLVSAYKTASNGEAQMVLFGVQPYVQKLFDITKLNRVLTITETQDEALEALSS